MRIRHIRDDDWDAVVALEAAAYTDGGLSEGRVALQSRAGASPATCFVLDHGSRTAGYLLALPYPMFEFPDLDRAEDLVFHSRNLHLHDLVIAEEFRGRGLAGDLLRHFTATAASKGYEAISLIAVLGSDAFWAANGYRAHREVTPPASYGADAVYMSRAVPDARPGRTNPAHAPSRRAPLEDEVG
ncbi:MULTISPECIES: GNAT family N-acetyltransferase [unclassified Streptomyces]|uniref:GNAT family N-acetyltransferase n=1 Tax=unclassified Streptomyces TaxID=2593676 RepID=UPI0037FFEE6F